MATWRKRSNPADVARAVARAETSPGAGSFSGFGYSEQLVLLGGIIELSADIPETERRRILNQATGAAAKEKALTPEGLLSHICSKESEYLRQPVTKFALQSGISIASTIAVPRCRLSAVSIAFGKKPRPSTTRARTALLRDARHWLLAEPPSGYLPLSATVNARSPQEGGSRALDALDVVRSIWNLYFNRGQSWRWSSGRHRPVNQVFLEPIHSLHKPDGTLATESWWYETAYAGGVQLISDHAKVTRMLAFATKARRQLAELHYPDAWAAALLRYGRALDLRDLNDAFLRLWGVLETLTDSTASPAAVTTRRAAFLFSDRNHAHLVLSQLAAYRNRFVHTGSETEEIEALLYLLKRHVEALLVFHLGYRFRFASIGEACEFLDLPSSRSALAKRLKMLQLATKFVVSS